MRKDIHVLKMMRISKSNSTYLLVGNDSRLHHRLLLYVYITVGLATPLVNTIEQLATSFMPGTLWKGHHCKMNYDSENYLQLESPHNIFLLHRVEVLG